MVFFVRRCQTDVIHLMKKAMTPHCTSYTMKKEIKETLDTKGKYRCVRFATGEVGMVDEWGNALIVLGQWDRLGFSAHGFLKITNQGRDVYMDTKNGELYASMPELVQVGKFELAHIGGMMYTRTRKVYELPEIPVEVLQGGTHSLYLTLPYDGEPEEEVRNRMIAAKKPYMVCLLNGDDSGVYWLIDTFADGTPLVMDDEGDYFHADVDSNTRMAEKVLLGKVDNEAAKAMMAYKAREIGAERMERMKEEEAACQARADREREDKMKEITAAEPFRIGGKWGLRQDGRILVPPIYRSLKSPVGHYSVVEAYPGLWGVIALDGKVEVEPRYGKVVLYKDGTAEMTSTGGRVVTKKLP